MFLRLTYLHFSPENTGKAKEAYMTEIASVIRNQKGNKEVLFLESADNSGEFISYSLWENESDIKEFEASADYVKAINRVKEFVSKAPEQKYFKVYK